ncbi:GTPase HflX [compost metagenome]
MDHRIPEIQGDTVYLSAKKRIGINELVEQIRQSVFKDYVQCDMLIPYDQGAVVSYLNEHANIFSTEYEEEGTKLTLECKLSDYGKYEQFVVLSNA